MYLKHGSRKMQSFNIAGRGPSPVIPLLVVLTLVLLLNGDGSGRRESCGGGGGGGGGGLSSTIRGLPGVVVAIMGIHYFLCVVLPSYQFPAGTGQAGDEDGYGLGTLLFFALFLILSNVFGR